MSICPYCLLKIGGTSPNKRKSKGVFTHKRCPGAPKRYPRKKSVNRKANYGDYRKYY